jgi:hypothetical protein
MAQGNHPIPSRTRKLSPAARMVLPGPPGGRVRRRRPSLPQRPPRSTTIGAGVAFLCLSWGRVGVRYLGRGAPSRAVVHETARGRLARPPPFRERWGRLVASRFYRPAQGCHSERGPMHGRRGGDDVCRAPEESSRSHGQAGPRATEPRPPRARAAQRALPL